MALKTFLQETFGEDKRPYGCDSNDSKREDPQDDEVDDVICVADPEWSAATDGWRPIVFSEALSYIWSDVEENGVDLFEVRESIRRGSF